MKTPIDYEVISGIAIITLNQPPVNAQGYALRCGLRDAIDRAADDTAVQAVVITGACIITRCAAIGAARAQRPASTMPVGRGSSTGRGGWTNC